MRTAVKYKLVNTVVVIAALGARAAVADAPKYTRTQSVRIDAPRTERTRPLQAHELPPATPSVTGSDVLLAEERSEPLRRDQEQLLEKLIRNTTDDDPDKPELMFRLAELYAKQQRLWRIEAAEAEVQLAKLRARR